MLGGFIMHPKTPFTPHCDKDFLIHLQEYAVLPNNTIPNTMNMEYNWLLLNGKAGPANTPLIVRLGDRVRIRYVNLGMDHHPMHLHGNTFHVTSTEGGRIPEAAWWPGNTVLVGVAQSRGIEFVANNPGDWMIHCHLPHHMMNQMSSTVGKMTRPNAGMPAGLSMESGMGMLTGIVQHTSRRRLRHQSGPRHGIRCNVRHGDNQRATLASQGKGCDASRNGHHSQMSGMDDMQSDIAAERQRRPQLPPGRLHGRPHDGDGQDGRQARELRPCRRMERIHDGDDDVRSRATAEQIRRGYRAHAAGKQAKRSVHLDLIQGITAQPRRCGHEEHHGNRGCELARSNNGSRTDRTAIHARYGHESTRI